jgi:hypothetical protein
MLHSYLIGPFEVAAGHVICRPNSQEPLLRPGPHVDPETALRSLFDSEEQFAAAVRIQGVTAICGGIAFDVDHLNRDALRSIEQLVSKNDWIIIQVPCDPKVYTLKDLLERLAQREMRREEYRREQLEKKSQT